MFKVHDRSSMTANEQGFAAVGKFIFVAPGDVKPNRITAAEVKYKSQVVFRQPTEAE